MKKDLGKNDESVSSTKNDAKPSPLKKEYPELAGVRPQKISPSMVMII
jgi:hypothetical protein